MVEEFDDKTLTLHFLVTNLCDLDLKSAIFACNLEYDTSKIFTQILDAVIYLHQNRVFLNGLKPGNIPLTSKMDPVVMISDFGSATREDIFDGQVLNTTEYAAPELFYHQLHRQRRLVFGCDSIQSNRQRLSLKGAPLKISL